MSYYIYKHTSPNGLVYIGKTKQNPVQRWGNGDSYAGSPKFFIAIHLYGWDNFTHEIIEETPEDDNILAERERYWINYYCSNLIGYNIQGHNIFGDVEAIFMIGINGTRWKQLGGKKAHYALQETLELNNLKDFSAQDYDNYILNQATKTILKLQKTIK